MLTMGAATVLFALAPASTPVTLLAATLFGASYIGLTGLVLIWSTHLYPDRTSLGVGLSFFMITAGQAAGVPTVGWLIESTGPTNLFYAWAGLSLIGAALRPTNTPQQPPERPAPRHSRAEGETAAVTGRGSPAGE